MGGRGAVPRWAKAGGETWAGAVVAPGCCKPVLGPDTGTHAASGAGKELARERSCCNYDDAESWGSGAVAWLPFWPAEPTFHMPTPM